MARARRKASMWRRYLSRHQETAPIKKKTENGVFQICQLGMTFTKECLLSTVTLNGLYSKSSITRISTPICMKMYI